MIGPEMDQRYFDETHELLRKSIRTFVEREIRPFLDDWEEAEEIPRELYEKAADAGYLGLGYPEALGGTSGDDFHKIVQTE